MGMFEKVFKPNRKRQETDEERWAKTDEENAARVEKERVAAIEQARQKDAAVLEQAKEKFQKERPKLERRLQEIPKEIEDNERILKELTGPEMRRILDKEYNLNSALSPIDSTDPNRAREYEMWVSALKGSRDATQNMKANLGVQIDDYQRKISGLEKEKREAKGRIQRGY